MGAEDTPTPVIDIPEINPTETSEMKMKRLHTADATIHSWLGTPPEVTQENLSTFQSVKTDLLEGLGAINPDLEVVLKFANTKRAENEQNKLWADQFNFDCLYLLGMHGACMEHLKAGVLSEDELTKIVAVFRNNKELMDPTHKEWFETLEKKNQWPEVLEMQLSEGEAAVLEALNGAPKSADLAQAGEITKDVTAEQLAQGLQGEILTQLNQGLQAEGGYRPMTLTVGGNVLAENLDQKTATEIKAALENQDTPIKPMQLFEALFALRYKDGAEFPTELEKVLARSVGDEEAAQTMQKVQALAEQLNQQDSQKGLLTPDKRKANLISASASLTFHLAAGLDPIQSMINYVMNQGR